MKIMQVLPELNQGGVERGTIELSRELVRRGHSSFVVSSGGKLAEQIERDGGRHITLDVCSKNPLTVPLRVHHLKQILRQIDPDIVHARSRVPAWLCVFAIKGLNIPFVTTVHGFNRVSPYSRVMTRGQRVICVSRSVKEYIQRHYRIPEETLRVIHRGVDLQEFSPDRLDRDFMESFRNQFGLVGRYVAACVGRITPLKNIEAFIRAIDLCSKQMPDITGLIVGGVRGDKEGYFARLQMLADEMEHEKRIVFAGSQSKMAEIYSLADVLVMCSRKPESFGRSLVEAMAMDTPVISVARGGPLDIIEEGRSGLFCQDDSPEEIARCLAKAREISFSGLRQYAAEKFALDTMVEKELDVYKELLPEQG